MSRFIRPLALTGALIAISIAIPAGAGAVTTSPTSLNLGSQPVGTTGPAQGVSLDVPCSTPPVLGQCLSFALDAYYVNLSTTGDFAVTSNCPNPLGPTLTELLGTCDMDVAFIPTATGTRSGTLSTGTTDVTGLIPGPTVALSGIGTSPASTSSGTSAAQKKCKKHRKHKHKKHAKKCRKKKKRRK
ncbi:MAG: hypothetical protein QOD14_2524 [Solirubrobacterales bacterium]|nr:hypothetical protein [Solirubrobacterales bacterium]